MSSILQRSMIQIGKSGHSEFLVRFVPEKEAGCFPTAGLFTGKYLSTFFLPETGGGFCLLTGLGEKTPAGLQVKEAGAAAVRSMRERQVTRFSVDVGKLLELSGPKAVSDLAEGMIEGWYQQPGLGKDSGRAVKVRTMDARLCGVPGEMLKEAEQHLRTGILLGEAVNWARDMVNMPGNLFTPKEFSGEVAKKMEEAGVAWEVLGEEEIRRQGLDALRAVGESSGHPPCLMILRYLPLGEKTAPVGLVGKGVTCDTGGYCLKASESMLGIKGDMAGGAAVAAAVYSLAKSKTQANVVGLIPMCENRISPCSLVPGDVISSYGGRRIEICNTDAEGRLILADAVSYAVKHEQVKKVLDIATLTGAVVQMLGFSTAGLLTDSEEFYREFEKAFEHSGERYWRLPYFEEQEKMLESTIADSKNIGASHCGTITAGLFIRDFAEGRPWLHLDIAGTAWVDPPLFSYQSKGATGAGVTTLYYLLQQEAAQCQIKSK